MVDSVCLVSVDVALGTLLLLARAAIHGLMTWGMSAGSLDCVYEI